MVQVQGSAHNRPHWPQTQVQLLSHWKLSFPCMNCHVDNWQYDVQNTSDVDDPMGSYTFIADTTPCDQWSVIVLAPWCLALLGWQNTTTSTVTSSYILDTAFADRRIWRGNGMQHIPPKGRSSSKRGFLFPSSSSRKQNHFRLTRRVSISLLMNFVEQAVILVPITPPFLVITMLSIMGYIVNG